MTMRSSKSYRQIALLAGGYSMLDTHSAGSLTAPSIAYAYDSLTWCVRHAGVQPAWKNVFTMFNDMRIIIAAVIVFCLYAIHCYLHAPLDNLAHDIYRVIINILAVITNQSAQVNPTRIIGRMSMTGAYMFGLLVYTFTVSYYVMFIHMSILNHQISTRAELIIDRFQLAGSTHALTHIRDEFPPAMIERYRVCPNLDDCLAQLVADDRLAVAISRQHARNSRRVPKQKIYCFDRREQIMDYPVSAWLPADDPWIERFNERFRWALEGGLLAKWRSDSQTPQQIKHSTAKGPEVLTMEHLFTAAVLYITFFVLSIFILSLEHLINYHMRKPSPSRFWRWADMMIDGKRHFLMPDMFFKKQPKPQRRRVKFRRPTHGIRFGRFKPYNIEMRGYRHASHAAPIFI